MSNSLATAQAMLAGVTCPQCDDHRFDLMLRCDMAFGECLYAMTCEGCGLVYHVEKPEDDPEFGSQCSGCGSGTMLLTMICSNTTHSCREVYACDQCSEVEIREK